MRAIRFDKATASDPDTQTTTKDFFQDTTGLFRSGFWSSKPGRSDMNYLKNEMCVLLEGEVRITGEDGTVELFQAGDTFVIPRGFKGVWETLKPTRKFFAVYKPD